ncbi:MAG: tetratricopeptide repeat protein [Planctomycetota bacterium]
MAEERRVVAIVFAQAEGLDEFPPSRQAALVDELFRRLRAVIERHGGAVDKFIGDSVMAVFGAPVARGDDAASAVRAALDLREAIASQNLACRAGVNMGEVLWGSVAGDRPTAIGDAVNVARRLQEWAGRGEILVSGAVAAAARDRIATDFVEDLKLRGREAPIAVYVVRGLRDASDTASEPAVLPLVGRESELAALTQLLESGRGAARIVEGEAGSGKSRLLAEFRRRVRSTHPAARVSTGRALEGTHFPLGPFAGVLRGWAPPGEGARRWAEEVAGDRRTATLVLASVGDESAAEEVRGVDPEVLASDTGAAWERLFRGLARSGPVVACLEDLQWADAATPELLGRLAAGLRDVPVVFVGAARPGGPAPVGVERLPLGDLPPGAAARIAAEALGRPIAPDLAAFVESQSGGNPFYAAEISRWLDAHGLAAGSPARLVARPDKLPQGLHGLLVARLDALPTAEKSTLKVAGAIGPVFWTGCLDALLGRPAAEDLTAAAGRGLLARQAVSTVPGETEYSFAHALLRDAAYALLPKRERARLHEAAALHLESRIDAGGRRVRALAARQYAAAGRRAEADAHWIAAGLAALADLSRVEALEYAREAKGPDATLLAVRALNGLSRLADAFAEASALSNDRAISAAHRCIAFLDLAVIREKEGRFQEALEFAGQALSVAPDRRLEAEALWTTAMARFRLLQHADARRDVMEARRRAAGTTAHHGMPADLESRIDNMLGLLNMVEGRYEEAVVSLNAAFEPMRLAGDRRGQMIVLSNMGVVRNRLRQPEAALEALGMALEIARQAGDRSQEATIHNNAGIAHFWGKRLEAARDSWVRACEIRKEIGNLHEMASSMGNVSLAELRLGRYPEALAAAREALEFARQSKLPADISGALIMLGRAFLDLGRAEESLPLADEAVELGRKVLLSADLANALSLRADIASVLEGPRPALELGREALERGRGVTPAGEYALMYCTVVHNLLDLDEKREATAMIEEFWASRPPELGLFQCRVLTDWLMETGRGAEACALIEDTIERRGKVEGALSVEAARIDLALKRAEAGLEGAGTLLGAVLAAARLSGSEDRITGALAATALADPDRAAARAAFDEWNSRTGPSGQGEQNLTRLHAAARAAKRLGLPLDAALLFTRLRELAAQVGNLRYIRLASEAGT